MGKDKIKIIMMVSAFKTMDYLKENKNASIEEIMDHVLGEVNASDKAKIAAIASANFVFNYKKKNFMAGPKETIRELFDNSEEILSSVNSQPL